MTKLYKYQRKGVRLIRKHKGIVLLADEMGLGKSIQSLMYAFKYNKFPVIIVCPAFLKWNWEHEVKQHLGMKAYICNGRKPPYLDARFKHKVVIINYEILEKWIPFLASLKAKVLILDEVHRVKNTATKAYKNVKVILSGGRSKRGVRRHPIKRLIALSGTPLTQRPKELWGCLTLLWPEKFHTFKPFGQRYCKPRWSRWGWQYDGASNLQELNRKLKKQGMIRRLKQDVLKDLPAKTRMPVYLSLSRKDRKEYDTAMTDFRKWIKKVSPRKAKSALKADAVTKIGYVGRLTANLKLAPVYDWIDNFLEETDGKLVLAGVHRSILNEIHERYRHNSVLVTGKITGHKRHLAVQQFQKDKKTRLFIGNIKAAGVGLNLTAASALAFVEFAWTPGEMIQMEDRIHRIGQDKQVFIYYLIAKDTIEEARCKLLLRKQKTVLAVLDGKRLHTGDLDVLNGLIAYAKKAA